MAVQNNPTSRTDVCSNNPGHKVQNLYPNPYPPSYERARAVCSRCFLDLMNKKREEEGVSKVCSNNPTHIVGDVLYPTPTDLTNINRLLCLSCAQAGTSPRPLATWWHSNPQEASTNFTEYLVQEVVRQGGGHGENVTDH